MWCLRIIRNEGSHAALNTALVELLRTFLNPTGFGRLTGEIDDSLLDASWIEKLPIPSLASIASEFVSIIDPHVGSVDSLRYTWMLLRDNLHACNVYLTPSEILVRPLIPPTWTHPPFANALQRIFMSATLGEGEIVADIQNHLESVRRVHAGLHRFLSMSLIEARRRNASAFRLRFSQSLARRLRRPSHANVRSTTPRFGKTTNPFA
jgi:hypothetical protein